MILSVIHNVLMSKQRPDARGEKGKSEDRGTKTVPEEAQGKRPPGPA